MMYSYPFFSFPHFSRYGAYSPSHYPTAKKMANTGLNNIASRKVYHAKNLNCADKIHEVEFDGKSNCRSTPNVTSEKNSPQNPPTGFSFLNHFLHQEDRGEDEEFFNIFGLKLYYDDILLIGLIFFLYKEDVKDQYLFFALVLLLLS